MIILGIDPSITATGIATLVDGKYRSSMVVHTKPETPSMQRIHAIANEVIRQAQRADLVAMEDYSFQSIGQAHTAGELGGVIKYRLTYETPCRLYLFPVKTWRKAVLGNGGLQKDDVKLEMFKRHGLDGIPIDALEAVAVAMCGWLREQGANTWTKYQLEAFTVKPKRKKKGVPA